MFKSKRVKRKKGKRKLDSLPFRFLLLFIDYFFVSIY